MWWHPPVSPRAVFESEAGQIEARLGLTPLVSVTDHDDIAAGLELQALYAQRRAPISVEWTVPCGRGYFHLGVHNLPVGIGAEAWFTRLAGVTARPSERRWRTRCADLDAEAGRAPDAQSSAVGSRRCWPGSEHSRLLHEFLARHGSRLHALELNGYRAWKENASVQSLGQTTTCRSSRAETVTAPSRTRCSI